MMGSTNKSPVRRAKKKALVVQLSQGGPYFYRCIIPKDIQPFLEQKPEFRISLKTGLYCDASKLAQNLDDLVKRLFHGVRIRQECFAVLVIKAKLVEYLEQLLEPSKGIGYPDQSKKKYDRTMEATNIQPKDQDEKKEYRLRLKLFEAVVSQMTVKDIQRFLSDKRYPGKDTSDFVDFRNPLKTRASFLEYAQDRKQSKKYLPLRFKKITNFFIEIVLERYLSEISPQEQLEWLEEYDLSEKDIIKAQKNLFPIKAILDLLFKRGNVLWLLKDSFKLVKGLKATAGPVIQTAPKPVSERALSPQPKGQESLNYPLLSDAWADYCTENLKPSTAKEYQASFNVFKVIVGDMSMDQIDQTKVNLFMRTLKKLPHGIKETYGFADVEAMLVEEGYRQLAVGTKKNHYDRIKGFLSSWTEANPEVPVKLGRFKLPAEASPEADESARIKFSDQDIQAIFNPETYLSATKEFASKYWIPLIGLLTGCRLNEACQLQFQDIYRFEGVWVFDFNRRNADPNHYKTGKPKFNRIIPIHPSLLELGFLDYYDMMKAIQGRVRLFEELAKNSKDKYYREIDDWFNREYLIEVGVRSKDNIGAKSGLLTFHSFRHSIKTKLLPHVHEKFFDAHIGHSQGTKQRMATPTKWSSR